ncbi:glycosyltransferase family 2 protein [Planctomycetota bacterium]
MSRSDDLNSRPQLSVVVPLLNEEDNLEPLYDQITTVLSGQYNYELIFVDDGSTDRSFSILCRFQEDDPRVSVIRFRKNFGQTAAMSAGFEHAEGEVIIPLDADMQNDPADIPMLLEKFEEGYDVVSGWRKKRHDAALTRLLPSRIANGIISRITGVHLHDYGCTLKAYRKEVLDEINLYGEMHRFIPALASWAGASITEVVVNHRARTAGVAKYGLGRTFKVVLDLLTVKFLGSYSTKPIYVFGGLGGLCLLGAVASGLMVLYMKLANGLGMNRNPLLVLTALLITTAVQFIVMGLLAELLVRTYHESQGRPTYIIKEIRQSNGSDGDPS